MSAGWLFLIAAWIAWAVTVRFFWKAGAWLPYYVLGASGCAVLIVVTSRDFLPIETGLRAATAYSITLLSHWIGVDSTLTPGEPGRVLVIGVPFHSQWTTLTVGLESSGLLESSAIIGLLAFFPGGGLHARPTRLIVALVATFIANVIRVLIIVGIVGYLGQAWLEFAHIVFARAVFFVFTIAIFWYAISQPTLDVVHTRLRGNTV